MTVLTPTETTLVRKSFIIILSNLNNDTDLAKMVYEKLFKVAPQARGMFSQNMALQEEKLVSMLTQLVMSIGQPNVLNGLIFQLGTSHKAYGVEAAHYDILKEVLIDTFTTIAPEDFTPPTVTAWAKLYDAVANGMQNV